MKMNEYQQLALRTKPALSDHQLLAMTGLGVAGEAGECADLVKKHLFHGHTLDKTVFKKELGDVLWYIAVAAEAAGLTLDDVAATNIEKLRDRYPEGFSAEASRTRVDQ